ncbi:AAA family ATPase [Planctopirus limnophila]|nr:AAA family ATPase [Planctopirus limnophila]
MSSGTQASMPTILPASAQVSERSSPLPLHQLETTASKDDFHKSPDRVPWLNYRPEFFENLATILFRSARRHIAVTGMPGVGKTSALRAFSSLLQSQEWAFLKDHVCLELDARNIGPEDTRAVLEMTISSIPANTPCLLFVEGLSPLMKRLQGATNAPLFRALLGRRNVSVIAMMSPWEYADTISSDAAMRSLFSRVEFPEPHDSVLQEILKLHAQQLCQKFELDLGPELIDRCHHLSSIYLLSEFEPTKSIRLLTEAYELVAYRRNERQAAQQTVELEDLIAVLADKTGIPAETLAGTRTHGDFEETLSAVVTGQETAIRQVAAELRLIKAGLTSPNKPASVLLFAGLTGVGKTELAKRIAEIYSSSRRPQIYSMGNFTEPHSISGIIGVPPGYVGHEQGGRLINELNSDPYSVFLLDEAEKCHPNVWKPFLNLFDEGWIVDQRGVKAYADRAIFILTSNAGDRQITQLTANSTPEDTIAEAVRQALGKVRHERSTQPIFPPQFLARIQRIVVFRPLSEEAFIGIAEAACQRLQESWARKLEIRLTLSPRIPHQLGVWAHEKSTSSHHQEGGRLVQKLVNQVLLDALETQLLSRKSQWQGIHSFQVSWKDWPDEKPESVESLKALIQVSHE